jgi:pimeloyl-ACP methyl ester carboxylesterase
MMIRQLRFPFQRIGRPARRAAFLLLLGGLGAAHAAGAPGDLLEAVRTGRVEAGEIPALTSRFFEGYEIPEAKNPVELYRIFYLSRDYDGSSAEIQAQLFIPDPAGAAELPVLAFGSGTTGIADACAPSLERPEVRRWGYYRGNMLAYAGQGYIVIFPDYLGFNDPDRPQRYFSKIAEGQVMLDAVRAVYRFFAGRSGAPQPARIAFVAGYSQGGHAAFAAADLHASYAPEVPLAGIIGFGCTADVTTLLREGPYYAAFIFYTYARMYGRDEIEPAGYLQARWADTLERDAGRLCVDEFQRYYPFDGTKLYRPEFYQALHEGTLAEHFPRLHARLEENRSGLSGHGLPALIVQGLLDVIVTTPSQSLFVASLCAAGSPVRYLKLEGVRHRFTRSAGFRASLDWMAALRKGAKPPSDCPAGP